MPIRNPFRKAGAEIIADENVRPNSRGGVDRGFHKADVVGSKSTSAVDIKAKDAPEYKLSGMSTIWRLTRVSRSILFTSLGFRLLSWQRSMTAACIFQ